MELGLKGKVAIVTGSTEGIGKETAAMLLRLAASLALVFIGLEFLWALAIVTQADR